MRVFFPLLAPSWARLGALLGRFGRLLGCLGALFGRLGALLGASWEPLGALLGLSWGRLGALLGRLGLLWVRLGALLGRFGALLVASGAVLGRFLEPLGPFWAVLGPKKRKPEKPSKMILANDPTICSCEYRRCEYRIRWNSLWGHETCEGCAEMGRRCHANFPIGALGGAPFGATKRVRGVPKWGGGAMRTFPLGPSVELPMGPRSA